MMRDYGLRYWFTNYMRQRLRRHLLGRRVSGTTHIMFLICDHFEPRHNMNREDQDVARVNRWLRGYPRFAETCRQKFGHSPQHTWFYPPHHGLQHLEAIGRLAFDGYGEVELHYHHSDDSAETLAAGLAATVQAYNRRGLLLLAGNPPAPGFGFVHGDWALDNSAAGRFCGVNGELEVLRQAGCWGDFTMPSCNETQTRTINAIYYAKGDPNRAKAHDTGRPAAVGRQGDDGLFLMQGPAGINLRAPAYPRIENASLTASNWGRRDRIRFWINTGIHVGGRPEWVFVKLHSHGGVERDYDALFGARAMEMHRILNEQFNDGTRYRLHYVTAREAYNICRAAEAGADGEPDLYRDYELPKPATSLYHIDAEHDLKRCERDCISIANIVPGDVEFRCAISSFERLAGPLRWLEVYRDRIVLQTANDTSGYIRLEARCKPHVTGGRLMESKRCDGRYHVVIECHDELIEVKSLDAAGLTASADL